MYLMIAVLAAVVSACEIKTGDDRQIVEALPPTYQFLGFESEEAWGEHLVHITGCDDCHTPKTMTDQGPMPDFSLRLSGNPAGAPPPDLDRQAIEQNGYGACNPHMTAWTGPWGISYSANITPHETGIGNWSKEQFVRALREGKAKGLEGGRTLLPPMPWPNYGKLSDDEVSAIFAFLKSLPPVDNLIPPPAPPVAAPAES